MSRTESANRAPTPPAPQDATPETGRLWRLPSGPEVSVLAILIAIVTVAFLDPERRDMIEIVVITAGVICVALVLIVFLGWLMNGESFSTGTKAGRSCCSVAAPWPRTRRRWVIDPCRTRVTKPGR